MMYLEMADFDPIMNDEFIGGLVDGNTAILDTAELQTMSMVENYLSELYDMATEWSYQGVARNNYLVRLMVSLIRYDLYQRLPKGGFGVPQDVAAGRTEAVNWLMAVSQGNISAKLPTKTGPEGEVKTVTRWGSEPKKPWGRI